MSEDSAPEADASDTDPGPQVWRLDHPKHGVLEAAVGTPGALRTLDPGFPLGERSFGPLAKQGLVLLRDGAVVSRHEKAEDHAYPLLATPPEDDAFSEPELFTGPRRIVVKVAAFGTDVRRVTFKDDGEIVHFDPPPDSKAEARLAAIEASPWKRVVYPIAGGFGKSGWAIFTIIVVPMILDLLERLWPDIDGPDIDLPSIPLPDVDLPSPSIDISLPSIPWPSIPWPDIDLPPWVDFVLEYTKVWVPVLVGIVLAIVAVRQSRASRRTRATWEAERAAREAEQRAEGD